MDILLILILIVAILAVLTRSFRTLPPPQIIYVQPVTPEPVGGSPGCLLWVLGILILLVALGVIRF